MSTADTASDGPQATSTPAGAELSAEAFADLEPRAFWCHFHTQTTIARPSRQEELAAAHVEEWAAGHGFGVAGDEIGNLVGVLFLPANGTQIAAAEADSTGTTTLGKRVIDHSFQLPLQIA